MENKDENSTKPDAPFQEQSETQSETQRTTLSPVPSQEATSSAPNPKEDSDRSLSEENLELDADVLEDILFFIGEMGLYQKLMFLGMLPFTTFYVWVYLVQIFITVAPERYWCKISILEALPMELRRNLSAPGAATGTWDQCNTFDADWDQVLNSLSPPPAGTRQIPCPNGWEFEFTDIPYASVVVERGWVCSQAAYAPTAQSLFFVGALMGGLLFGWIADNFGRVPALVGANLIGGIGGISTTFTSGLWDFIFCRFLVGLSFDNCFMLPYILILEYVGPGHRTWVANMPVAIFGGAAGVSLPWIAYFISDWRLTLWVTSLPMFGAIISPWVMPESVRWLVSRGRIDDAVKVIRKFERVNKTTVPDEVMDKFIATSKKIGSKKMESFFNIFQSRLLCRTMIYMIVVYGSDAAIYDTLVRVTQMFGLDFFITFTINVGIEIPSVLLLTALLDRVGRRLLTGGTLFMGGITLFLAMLVSKGLPRVSLGVLARFLINIAFTVLCQWGTEILPTPFRASGSAFLHMTGFATSLLSPFIVFSETLWQPLPLLIASLWALITGVLTFLLPETKGQEMPQTVTDAEKIIIDQSLCTQPEVKEFKQSLSKVLITTVGETIQRDPSGRVSRLRLH
ncbi:unnamed protein product [Arctia plantaginis]|uniref:Major facilitator superfamily (MFS) profile domain-containing protein n=1 Tax=Arctia plantaginis TaxID=874455 RepID=A0A8S1ALA2_ARCPL|nr:unnamed protein product [Arctia plantaginis]